MSLLINANTVSINGVTVPVNGKPKWKGGAPKVTVKTATVGDKVMTYEEVDYTEAIGSVTISIMPTVANVELFESWQANIGKNAIRIVDTKTQFTKTFNNMSISEDVEFDTTDAIEIVFMGGQGV